MEDPWATDGADYPLVRKNRSKLKTLLGITVVLVMSAVAFWIVPPYIDGVLHPDSAPARPIKAVAISPDRPDFVSDDFGFAVKFPGEPVRGSVAAGLGKQSAQMTTFQSGANEAGYQVAATYLRCTPKAGDVELLLRDAVENSVKAVSTATESVAPRVEAKNVTVQNHPALEASYAVTYGKDKLHVSVAVLFAGSRYFAVLATNPPDGGWDTFLSSFKVTADGGALPACAPTATT